MFNCPDSSDYPRKTLAELRQAIFDGLGFITTLSTTSFRSLADLRTDVLTLLGLAEPADVSTRTVADLRAAISYHCGQGAMASPPPGFQGQSLAIINQAQQTLFRRLELDKGGITPPVILTLDSDTTDSNVDSQLTLTLSIGLAKAHYQQPDAKAYFDAAEKQLADTLQRRPPNIVSLATTALQSAQRTIRRRIETGSSGDFADAAFAADDDECSVDPQALLLLACANLKTKVGQSDAKLLFQQYETYLQDLVKRSPPNATSLINRLLKQTQEALYRTYEVFRTERLFSWTLASGQRYYGLGTNDETQALPTPTGVNLARQDSGGDLAIGTYAYRVSATNEAGESLASAELTIAAITNDSAVLIAWDAPTDNLPRTGFNIYGRTSAGELLLASVGADVTSWTDDGSLTPAGALPSADTTRISARTIDPLKVTWVGVSQGDNAWRPLRCGIPPSLYASPVQGVPTHYEIRQCIEVWPAPVDGWLLRMKGHFGLDAFDADSDSTTLDWQAVQLQTLAVAKAHYNHPDKQEAAMAARRYIGDLIAGSHMTNRYFPGSREPINAVRPVLV